MEVVCSDPTILFFFFVDIFLISLRLKKNVLRSFVYYYDHRPLGMNIDENKKKSAAYVLGEGLCLTPPS